MYVGICLQSHYIFFHKSLILFILQLEMIDGTMKNSERRVQGFFQERKRYSWLKASLWTFFSGFLSIFLWRALDLKHPSFPAWLLRMILFSWKRKWILWFDKLTLNHERKQNSYFQIDICILNIPQVSSCTFFLSYLFILLILFIS